MVQVVYPTSQRSGDRKIKVTVDAQNFIVESSEYDNDDDGYAVSDTAAHRQFGDGEQQHWP